MAILKTLSIVLSLRVDLEGCWLLLTTLTDSFPIWKQVVSNMTITFTILMTSAQVV